MRHLPNAITASRGLAGLAVAWLLLEWQANFAAFTLFILAISSDLVDGWLARRLGSASATGELLDPLADKMLVATTWVGLLLVGWAPAWLAVPLLIRDACVAVGWRIERARGVSFEPTMAGRLMISFEGVTLPLLLFHVHWAGVHWMSAGVILGVITLALSVVSAAEYASQALRA